MDFVTPAYLSEFGSKLWSKKPVAFKENWVREHGGPVRAAMDRYYSERDDRTGDLLVDVVRFFQFVVTDIVQENREPTLPISVVGIILWHKIYLMPLLSEDFPDKKRLTPGNLKAHMQANGDAEFEAWRREYQLPAWLENPFLLSKSAVYKDIAQGLDLLAERLNGPLTRYERIPSTIEISGIPTEVQNALRRWLDDVPGAALEQVYVSPWLIDAHSGWLSEDDLLARLCDGKWTFVQGDAGMGKSFLLRSMGLRLLEFGYLPVWLAPSLENPKHVLRTREDLVAHVHKLLARFGAPRHQVEATVAWGIENARVVFLVEEGERWSVGAAEHIMSLPHLARGVLAVGRPTELWRHLDQVEIAWDAERLHKIMDRWGSDTWFAQLDAWSREGRLARRPWEYAAIARLTKLERVTHPVQVLQLLLTPIADARNEDAQQTGKNRQELRRRAWHATLDGQDLWQAKETTAGMRWGLDKRLLVDTGEGYRFAHSLWQSYFAAEYATKRAPVSVAAQLVGVRDWAQVVAWALALGDTRWVGRLLEAVAGELSRTWRGSGWLQGAQAVGAALSMLDGYASVRRVRVQAEQALLALLPPEAEFEAVDKALLALAPLSQDTVDYLWREIFFCRWHDGYFILAEEPGVARRLLSLEKPTREDDVYLLWCIARSSNVDLEQLIAAGERWFDGGNARRWRISAVSGALCIQGTDAAAWRLATWLEQEAQIDTDADFAYKLRKNLEEGLRLWVNSKWTLAKNMATLFREEIPDWIWRPVLNAMLRDRDAARPILQAWLDDPNVMLSSNQRYYLDSEVNFWNDDSPRTFDVAAEPDLSSPWCLTEPHSWEIAASFFERLANGDGHLWYVMDWIVRQDEVKTWAGEEHKYAQGLRAFALDGTPPQQAAALTWLTKMPADFGRGALNRGELVQLLDAEWVVSRAALDYFAAHGREDVLDKVKAMCVFATIEGKEIEKQIRADGWSEELMCRCEEVAALQHALAAALRAVEVGGSRLVSMALGEGVAATWQMIGPRERARTVLIHSPQHFETLLQAVVEGRASEWWLTAAIAVHGVILEDTDGEFVIREGEKRFLLHEWVTKQTGSS